MNLREKCVSWGLVLALSENTVAPQGRLRGKLEKLGKEATRQLGRLPKLGNVETIRALQTYRRFEGLSGWGPGIHPATFATALLAMLEDSPPEFDKAIKLIVEIVDYFEGVGEAPALVEEGAVEAEKLWMECMEAAG